ncbi:putative PepSY-like beta-lactamase-inhibitor [Lacibacter cauensis]|uniref:Putative PepSY-like beta-lactamase-inhibitor n=1 Tax=Lacibacter cauensis TaxID=510947 RepID=A0A562SJH8_9BACT|nr:PepSY-like domain-containing protein [Lacibacter cauensis]TWI81134.1 putative PepSY-like beta-lactamase-inhibitor [Lacibacter cauensis]
MKKLASMLVAAVITSLTFAQKIQEKDVPASVKTSFQKHYPSIKEVKWDKEGEKFEASFDLNKIDNSVLFDAQGNILEAEVEIELNQLPKGILEYVASNYKGQKVKEAAKITDARGTVTYEAEIKGLDLLFDSNGKFIKETKD